MKLHLLKLGIALTFLFFGFSAEASHFRYGTISYQVLSETGSGASKQTVVQFTMNQGWRRSAYGAPVVGSIVGIDYFYFGDSLGSYVYYSLTVTAINATEDWFIGTTTFNFTYTGNVDLKAYTESCCRISTLQDGNADGSWRLETLVTLSQISNESPISSLPAMVNVPDGVASYNINLNTIDPNADVLTYAQSTFAQSYLSASSIFTSVNSSTGVVTLNTSAAPVAINNLYALQFMVTDSKGATSPIDFIVRIVGSSNPPQFIAPTPANASTIKVVPGTPINFTVSASDVDAGDLVTLLGSGIPATATFTPGAAGNPVSTAFSWTPTVANLGSYSLSFSATDNNAAQTLTTVNIVVSLAPVFNVPPTPAEGTHVVVVPGNLLNFTVQATDPDVNDVCQIMTATGKDMANNPIPIYAGVTFNPVLPTPAANVTSTVVSWTPTLAQWGHRHMIFTAKDGYNDQTTHEVSVLVNTPPAFLSTPLTSACVGQLYTYNISVTDADLGQGDMIDIYAVSKPAWLTFTDNGNGTATLSGTPTAADLGINAVSLSGQDMFHHQNGSATQIFNINVASCGGGACSFTNTLSAAKPAMVYQNAGANLANTYYWGLSYTMYITANPVGGVGPYTYAWTSKSGYTIFTPSSKTAGLYYPTGAGWVKVAITDVGASCTTNDSIYIDFVDYTCPPQPGMLWWYQLCNTQTQTPVCAFRTWYMNSLVSTGNYTFGSCSPKTNSVANNSGFTVYPNPTAGYITIEQTFDVTSKGTIDVLDINGRVLYTEKVELNEGAFNYTVNLSNLPNGLYLVRLSSDREFFTERVQLIK